MSITITRGEQITVGRRDYGWGVPGTLVDVGGEPFVDVGGTLYSACGMCSPDYSGSKSYYGHVLNGVCFQCNGKGVYRKVGTEADAERVVKRRIADRARAERKRAEAEAAAVVAADQWAAENPEVAAMLAEVREDAPEPDSAYVAHDAYNSRWGGDFLPSLAVRAQYNALTEKQTAAVPEAYFEAKAAQAAAEEKAAKARYHGEVGEKVTITGTVVVATSVEVASFSGYGTSHSMLVVVEGVGEFEGVTAKAFGTGKTLWDAERGQSVEISGTVKKHEEYEGTPQTVLTRAKVAETG